MLPFKERLDKVVLPSEDVLDKLLSKAKLEVFRRKGSAFLSSLMCSLEFVWTEEITTAATDGKKLYWNPKFFYSIPTEERVFVIVHEIWHVAYQHVIRLNGRDPMTHNIAADHVINTMLVNEGYSVKNLGIDIYQDMKYHEWSVDKVYEDLIKNPPPPTGGSGQTPEPEGKGSGGSASAEPEKGLADDIIQAEDSQSFDVVQSIITAVQQSKISGEAGVIPGEIEEMIDLFLNPILPWEQLLQAFLTELSNDDYSYRRPSRRYDDPILPSLISDGGLQVLNWYVDVSGSISSAMLLRFFSEMVYVKETFNPEVINIIQFDMRISKETVLEADDDFNSMIVYGRGGTNLEPVHDHIKKTNPNAAIIFSDMECNPMEEVDIPVVWFIFRENGRQFRGHTPNFGTVVQVKED